jgi:hypothetical protein
VTFNLLHRERIHELGRVGAPYDIYLLDDLARPDFPEYKLYVFLNAFSLPAAQRRAIDEKVKRDGKVALWFYAPGIIHPEATPTASPAHARKLIGLNLRVERGSYPLEMEWQSAGPLPPHPPRMRGGARGGVAVEKGTRLGNFARMITTGFDVRPPDFPPLTPPPCVGDPRVVVEDPQAEPLATYTDGGGVGFALRRFPHWTSIFYGSQALPAGVLRSIAAYAGVHVYNSQDDVLYANRHFLALHTREGGRREIALPGRVEVIYDLFGQRVVARHVDRFHLQLAPFSTTLLYCGDEAGFEPR